MRKSGLIILIKIILAVILLEVSLFNIKHWTTRFIGPGTDAFSYQLYHGDDIIAGKSGGYKAAEKDAQLTISGIDEIIRTVFIRPDFSGTDIKQIDVSLYYQDENNGYTHTAQLLRGYESGFYIPLGAMGKVSDLVVIFHNRQVEITQIRFNETLPWSFQWIRVIFLTLVISSIYLRKKFNWGNVKFLPQCSWQKRLDACVVLLFIGLLFSVCIFSVDFGFIPGGGNELKWNTSQKEEHIINAKMAEALLSGQLHLDYEPDEALLSAANPYNPLYRANNGINGLHDHVFYEGKYYSYFGIVPVILLFLPYFLLTGHHLSATAATFIFSAIAAFGILMLWREIAKKYLRNLPYTVYLACLMAVLFGSNLMLLTVRAYQYEAALSGMLMFSVWGIFFLLRALCGSCINKKALFMFLSGASLALAVGCRPTALFCSLLVPVLLFPVLRSYLPPGQLVKDKGALKKVVLCASAFILPYMAVGAALAWYNYARFGSVTEFGINYHITVENVAAVTQSGLLGNIRRAFDGIFSYLFTSFSLQPRFPFIYATSAPLIFTGYMTRQSTIGLFFIPVTLFLPAVFFMRKSSSVRRALPVIIAMTSVSLLLIISSSVLSGVLGRYTAEFFWLFMTASALSAGLVYKQAANSGESAAKAVQFLCIAASCVSCFILLGWGMIGEENLIWDNNPIIFRYLSDLIIFF